MESRLLLPLTPPIPQFLSLSSPSPSSRCQTIAKRSREGRREGRERERVGIFGSVGLSVGPMLESSTTAAAAAATSRSVTRAIT